MKDNPIGTTFMEGNVMLLVQKSPSNKPVCVGCYYNSRKSNGCHVYPASCCVHGHACTPLNRKDGNHVVFRKIRLE